MSEEPHRTTHVCAAIRSKIIIYYSRLVSLLYRTGMYYGKFSVYVKREWGWCGVSSGDVNSPDEKCIRSDRGKTAEGSPRGKQSKNDEINAKISNKLSYSIVVLFFFFFLAVIILKLIEYLRDKFAVTTDYNDNTFLELLASRQ